MKNKKNIIAIIVFVLAIVIMFGMIKPCYDRIKMKEDVVNHLEILYGDGDFKIVESDGDDQYTVKTSYMDFEFNVSKSYDGYIDNFLDVYSEKVWKADLHTHLEEYLQAKLDKQLNSNDAYFTVKVYLVGGTLVKDLVDKKTNKIELKTFEEKLLSTTDYNIKELVIKKDKLENLDDLIIKALQITEKNTLEFRNLKTKETGYVKEYNNAYYIYYTDTPKIIKK